MREQGLVLAGAQTGVDDPGTCLAELATTPAPTSTAGVPQEVSANASGTSAATSARIVSGTS